MSKMSISKRNCSQKKYKKKSDYYRENSGKKIDISGITTIFAFK